MSLSLRCTVPNPLSSSVSVNTPDQCIKITALQQTPCISQLQIRRQRLLSVKPLRSELNQSVGGEAAGKDVSASKLVIGSPIIITEAPRMIKTAASVPCLRVNDGLVNAGDVGRILSRKPMDVWAVRLSIGTYLIDGKYFKPLDLEE